MLCYDIVIILTQYCSCISTRPLWSMSEPNIGRLAHPTTFWQGEEISNRCVCHVSWHVGHCIPLQPIKRQADSSSRPYGGICGSSQGLSIREKAMFYPDICWRNSPII